MYTPEPDASQLSASLRRRRLIGTMNSANKQLSNPNNLTMEYEFSVEGIRFLIHE